MLRKIFRSLKFLFQYVTRFLGFSKAGVMPTQKYRKYLVMYQNRKFKGQKAHAAFSFTLNLILNEAASVSAL